MVCGVNMIQFSWILIIFTKILENMIIKKYLIIALLINIKFYSMVAQGNDTSLIQYKPIGIFHTAYTTATGAPRQGILMPETEGAIEIFPPYRGALNTLSLFEYIIVLYHFSEVERWEPTVNPPASTHEHDFGLFSTRSPKRPNPIGLSIVKLEKIEEGILYISGVDAFDGTPVLDIKPYLPSVDCVKSIQNELIEKELGHHDENFISDSTFYK
jgi:tRNA-Thr(GGU) m(6)t(6)A37 methyltransferase TsaA